MSDKGTEQTECSLCDVVETLERIEARLRPTYTGEDIVRVVGDYMPLRDLSPGTVYLDEYGQIGLKTADKTPTQPKCYSLRRGKPLAYEKGNDMLVREVWLPFETKGVKA